MTEIKSLRFRPKRRFWLIFGILCLVIFAIILANAISNVNDKTSLDATEEAAQTPEPKVYNFPPASEENDLLKIATSVEDSEQKVCYLTFDDGPTKEVTPLVLEVLGRNDVKATFFILGRMLEENRDIGKRIYDEGHLIANHSYYHKYEDLYKTPEAFMGEIEMTNQLIADVTGEEPFKLIRFPGGGHNAGKYGAQKQEYKNLLKEKGFYFVDWNCLNGDAEASLRSAEQLLQRVKETAVGRNIVILMHDAATKKTTPEALGSIIEYLRGQGYEFRRLDDIDYYSNKTTAVDTTLIL